MAIAVLIVTPLQEEYDDLHQSLCTLGLESRRDRIGRLEVNHFPALHVTLARGGHGKTQFGIQTQHLLVRARFDLFICAGAAGALSPEIKVGDLIIATSTVEHDYNLKFDKRPNPQFAGDTKSIEQIRALDISKAKFNIHFGIMAGGKSNLAPFPVQCRSKVFEALQPVSASGPPPAHEARNPNEARFVCLNRSRA